jgi:hypothetical protein
LNCRLKKWRLLLSHGGSWKAIETIASNLDFKKGNKKGEH